MRKEHTCRCTQNALRVHSAYIEHIHKYICCRDQSCLNRFLFAYSTPTPESTPLTPESESESKLRLQHEEESTPTPTRLRLGSDSAPAGVGVGAIDSDSSKNRSRSRFSTPESESRPALYAHIMQFIINILISYYILLEKILCLCLWAQACVRQIHFHNSMSQRCV